MTMVKKKSKEAMKTIGIIMLIMGILVAIVPFMSFATVQSARGDILTEKFRAGEQVTFFVSDSVKMPLGKCDNAVAEIILINDLASPKRIYFQSDGSKLSSQITDVRRIVKRTLEPANFQKPNNYAIEARFLCQDSGANVPAWHAISGISYGDIFVDKQYVSTCTTGTYSCGDNRETIECQEKSDGSGNIKVNVGVVVGKCGVDCKSSSQCSSSQECKSNKCVAKEVIIPPDICTEPTQRVCVGNSVQEQKCGKYVSTIKTCTGTQECVNGACRDVTQPVCADQPSKPCDGAVWSDYPTCLWDTAGCPIGCTEDTTTQCNDGTTITVEVCENGRLTPVPSTCPVNSCSADTDCSDGFKCVESICKKDDVKVEKPDETKIYFFVGGGILFLIGGALLIAGMKKR